MRSTAKAKSPASHRYHVRKFKELHGNNDAEDLCWFAPSTVMNPKLPQAVIDKALAEDKQKGSAEYLNVWREDLADFVPLDVVEDCTDNVYERPPRPGVSYVAYDDAAGGLGSDSFSLAISHREGDTAVLDLIREKKPRFVPRDVIAEFAATLKLYNISTVVGDGYAGGFHADEWSRNNITFKPCDNTTSENYLHALPMLLARRARLLQSATLRSQLTSLERSVQPSGHEVVRHPQIASAHDDVAAAACGVLVLAGSKRTLFGADAIWLGYGPSSPSTPDAAARAAQEESDANFRWRMSQYMRSIGVPYGF